MKDDFLNTPELWRRLYFSLSCLSLCLFSFLSWQGEGSHVALWKILAYLGVSVSGFGAWFFFPSRRLWFCNLRTIFLLSVIVRLLFWGMDVSDDVNRYLWEGKLVTEGVSPYHQVAEDDYYDSYKDQYFALMNHRDRLTAYPPFAMIVFALIAEIDYGYSACKAAFIFFDLLVVLVLLAILYEKKLPLRHSLLYALNPIVLFSFAGEAHYDSLFILGIVAAYYFWIRGKEGWAWAFVGIAVQVKVLAIILIPWLFFRSRKKSNCFVFIFVVSVPCLLFWQDLDQFWKGLYGFGVESAFNGPLHGIIRWLTGSIEFASWVTYGIFAFSVLAISKMVRTIELAWYGLWTVFLLCSSIVHFWYVAWVLPFIVLIPSPAFLWLSCSMSLYFLTNYSVDQGGDWSLPLWASLVQWIPFMGLMIWENRNLLFRAKHDTPQPVEGYGVVIPVYQDAPSLRRCLQSLREQTLLPERIIIVDGGKEPHLLEPMAKHYHAEYLASEPGRGIQVAEGVQVLDQELILILHADVLIPRPGGSEMVDFMNRNPHYVGGVLGQRFSEGGALFPLVEGLNDMRISLGGSGFGDQGQFFRKSILNSVGGFPRLKLMEDIALSDRLLKAGYLGFLDKPLLSSSRSWLRNGFANRFLQVLSCILRYRWAQIRGKDITEELYKSYYSEK